MGVVPSFVYVSFIKYENPHIKNFVYKRLDNLIEDSFMRPLIEIIESFDTYRVDNILRRTKNHYYQPAFEDIVKTIENTLLEKYNRARGKERDVYDLIIKYGLLLMLAHVISHNEASGVKIPKREAQKLIKEINYWVAKEIAKRFNLNPDDVFKDMQKSGLIIKYKDITGCRKGKKEDLEFLRKYVNKLFNRFRNFVFRYVRWASLSLF